MGNKILVRKSRDPLFGMTKKDYIDTVKKKLSGRADEAYFFGSFTGPDFNRFSDIDIIIICKTEKPFPERAMDFADLLDIVPSTDILVYTHEEFKNLINLPSPGFWKSVKESIVRFL